VGIKKTRSRTTKKKIQTLVVDGNSLMKRSHSGARNMYYKEKHIGGIFQFYSTLRKVIVEHKIDRVVIMWDGERGGYLRLKFYNDYKKNRNKHFDDDYELQSLRVKQYAEELFIRQYEHPNCEADDLIAHYCLNKNKNEEVIIFTSDRDLCQLITEEVSIYLADKKTLIGIGNYKWHFPHYYKNIGLIKVIEGCSSDNIKGVNGVGEKTLLGLFPELKEREVTLKEILEKSKELQKERGKKPLKSLTNIINGVSDGSHVGNMYEVNEIIVNLKHPLLTEEAIEEVNSLLHDDIDPEGRDYKHVLKMMIEDGIMQALPGGENGYISFIEPFVRLIKKEKTNIKKQRI
jgi:DNA polymerase-1